MQHLAVLVPEPEVDPHWATTEVLAAVVTHAVIVVRLCAVLTVPQVDPDAYVAKMAVVL